MKVAIKFICVLCLIFLQSCMDSEFPYLETDMDYCVIQGNVTDQDGTPLEKIRVRIRSKETNLILTAHYTSSEGSFCCEIPIPEDYSRMVLEIIIDDIDIYKNGGLFESKTDLITIFEEDYRKRPVIIDLPTYRLNHATASENSPRS